MPCEACLSQFTIFRRKRVCNCCRRFYCGNCVNERSSSKGGSKSKLLCTRCAIFAKRPLVRAELLQLKAKDLIFYLQSKHISTAGCVEKEELVALILLHHAQQTESPTSPTRSDTGSGFSSHSSPSDETATTFDNIKQTCQNFFGNISENISDSFMNGRSAAAKSTTMGGGDASPPTASNITSQPRVTVRAMPTYASSSRPPPTASSKATSTTSNAARPSNTQQASCSSTSTAPSSNGHTSQTASPVVSFDSTASPQHAATRAGNGDGDAEADADAESNNCECSDHENDNDDDNAEEFLLHAGAVAATGVGCDATLTVTAATHGQIGESDLSTGNRDDSPHSSFEELGAIGGISDDSKAATDTNSGNTDQWQLLDGSQRLSDESGDGGADTDAPKTAATTSTATTATPSSSTVEPATSTATAAAQTPAAKKMTRRRSDGYLNRSRRLVLSDDELSPTGGLHVLAELDEAVQRQRPLAPFHCRRCGKNKLSIRQHIERMRRHLEGSQMSEAEVKQELQTFLAYLEKRTMSMDSEDAAETQTQAQVSPIATTTREAIVTAIATASSALDDSDGIHVYGSNAPSEMDTSRFINLADFESLDGLESLTVKQLKEVLMLNRVDYKGCCEKQELLDRVTRLWQTLKKAPAVEKLPTDELCKICMDAPIECIILECGHMATCTNCGKVLSECPICRQYIVRVVRFFRA